MFIPRKIKRERRFLSGGQRWQNYAVAVTAAWGYIPPITGLCSPNLQFLSYEKKGTKDSLGEVSPKTPLSSGKLPKNRTRVRFLSDRLSLRNRVQSRFKQRKRKKNLRRQKRLYAGKEKNSLFLRKNRTKPQK